jgi:hypothetical protein
MDMIECRRNVQLAAADKIGLVASLMVRRRQLNIAWLCWWTEVSISRHNDQLAAADRVCDVLVSAVRGAWLRRGWLAWCSVVASLILLSATNDTNLVETDQLLPVQPKPNRPSGNAPTWQRAVEERGLLSQPQISFCRRLLARYLYATKLDDAWERWCNLAAFLAVKRLQQQQQAAGLISILSQHFSRSCAWSKWCEVVAIVAVENQGFLVERTGKTGYATEQQEGAIYP